MSPRTILQHALVAAVASAAVAAPAAVAKPTDRVDRYDNVTPRPYHYTDLRGEHAMDAARAAEQEHFLPGQPTWPTHPAPLPKPVVKPASSAPSSDGGIDEVWLIVGLGFAAAGIVGGSAAGLARRSRVRARRVAV
jgi:hypothetical protein